MLIKRLVGLMLLVVFLCILGGCASFDKNINAERVLVQIAVMKVIEKSPGAEQSAKAGKIIKFASDARTWIGGEAVPYDQLREVLLVRIGKLDIDQSEKLLAVLVVDNVLESLKKRVVNGIKLPVTTEEYRYQVNTVLDWIEEFASVYV